jgi:hypothetical protein
MTHSGSRRGAANLAPVLMILSFLCMAGLLVWLGKSAEESQQAVIMDESEETDSLEASAAPVTLGQLQTSAEALLGQMVRVEGVPVTSQVGRGVFLIGGGEASPNPVLVVLDSALIAAGDLAPAAGSVTIVGTVRERGDTDVDEWVESNLLTESGRAVVDPSTHWVHAHRVRPSEEGSAPGSDPEAGQP